MVDRIEVEERAVAYMNKLVDGLHLNHTLYTEIDEIQVQNLVEINCRLLGLNFNDYIPSQYRPWEDVQRIIFSLQDRFGADKFKHLSPRYIASRNPLQLTCILQIFNAIYDHGKKKHRRFLPVTNNQENTLLDDSTRGQDDSSNGVIEVSANDTSASGSTLEVLKFNFILDDSDDLSDMEFQSPQNSLTSSNSKSSLRSTADDEDEDSRDDEGLEYYVPEANFDEKDRSKRAAKSKTRPVSSTPKTSPKKKTAPLPPKAPSLQNLQSGKSASVHSVDKLAKPAVVATGTITEKKRTDKNKNGTVELICDPAEIQRYMTEAITKLNQVHIEVQKHVRDRLTEIEKRFCGSNVVDGGLDCLELQAKNCGHMRRRNKMLPPCLGFAKLGPIKYDYFGNPYRERFPFYPGGIIKIQCHPSSKKILPQPSPKSTRKDGSSKLNKAEAEKLSFEIYEQLNILQEMINNQLSALQEEFVRLTQQEGPRTFDRIRSVWSSSYIRLKKETIKIVDTIIELIDTAYAVKS